MASTANHAAILLRISQVIYILLATLVALLLVFGIGSIEPTEERSAIFITLSLALLIVIGMSVLLHFVIRDLRKKKFWAWVASICLFALYLPSIFLPIGILGLYWVLNRESRKEFATHSV